MLFFYRIRNYRGDRKTYFWWGSQWV